MAWRTSTRGRRYDALVCLFSAIGYVRTVERQGEAMRTFARHMLPGGRRD